jgi:hypothetical protein
MEEVRMSLRKPQGQLKLALKPGAGGSQKIEAAIGRLYDCPD